MKRTADMRAPTVIDLFLKSQIVRELQEHNRLTAEKMTKEKGGNGSPGKENIPPTPPIREKGTPPYPQKDTLSNACAREGIERLADYLTKQLALVLGHDNDSIPTLDDVRAYHKSETIREQFSAEILDFANPDLFWNYYDSHEWPMGDWHALYRAWILRRKEDYRKEKLVGAGGLSSMTPEERLYVTGKVPSNYLV